MNRRQFLWLGGVFAFGKGMGFPRPASDPKIGQMFPKTLVCRVSDLEVGKPRTFRYLHDDLGSYVILKKGTPSPGGISASKDIVAFNLAVTTPEVALELRGDSIYATGFLENSFDIAASTP